MSSYIVLELDTTPPEIDVYCPSYTTTDLSNEITIVSNNDILAESQEIYVIDSNGERHDYTFQRERDNEFVGIVKFALFPIGMATIYVRMVDDVGNVSNLISKSFEIKESLTILTLDINDKKSNIDIENKSKNIMINSKSTNANVNDFDLNIDIDDKSMKIKLRDIEKAVDTYDN